MSRDYTTITIDKDLKNELAELKPARCPWGHFLETELLADGERR